MKNDNGIGFVSNFVPLSIFSYRVHTPDRNFEDSGKEITWAQLEMNTTVAACMGTTLYVTLPFAVHIR